MKQFVISLLVVMALAFAAYCLYDQHVLRETKKNIFTDEEGISYVSKVDGENIYFYDGKSFEKTFLKGVNLGVAKPGYFPGEFAITKDEYLRWFKQIKEMNANVIRVYITQNPDFYEALYEFNRNNDDPLYVVHGVWVDENVIAEYNDAFAEGEAIKNDFLSSAKEVIDVIHGNKEVNSNLGSWTYRRDVSHYIVGWILGVEWDPEFVTNTNENHPERADYEGDYLYTRDASPFEAFLCEVANETIRYESETYRMQRPLAITNWLTTDPLDHPNEPLETEDMASVDLERVHAKETVKTGLFASYHVYPYYPDFLNYDTKYIAKEEGEVNTYRAYLKELKEYHTMPVLVAEVGIPSARGIAHEDVRSGFNQGHVTEDEQGRMLESLIKDINGEGYMGALIFSWQDEWFKRTWNTMDYDVADRRAYWGNAQTNEQYFGILGFEPGEKERVCYIDGAFEDWKDVPVVSEGNGFRVFFQYDAEYMYFLVQGDDYEFERDALLLPISTIANQGNAKYGGLAFEQAADFLLSIHGKEDSRLLVDSYYDTFRFTYPTVKISVSGVPKTQTANVVDGLTDGTRKDTGVFHKIYLALNRELYLPETKVFLPFSAMETGLLRYGNANPDSADYDSLADFIYEDGKLEMRLPWLMLNVADPSSKQILADFREKGGLSFIQVKDCYIGAAKAGSSNGETVTMGAFTWEGWDLPVYHERLKRSYERVKETFGGL